MLFSILNSSASTVLAVNLALVALMMAPHVENRRSTDVDLQIQLLVEMDILLITYTKNGRLSLAMTLYYIASIFVIWDDFKSNHKISNQIEIKSHVF